MTPDGRVRSIWRRWWGGKKVRTSHDIQELMKWQAMYEDLASGGFYRRHGSGRGPLHDPPSFAEQVRQHQLVTQSQVGGSPNMLDEETRAEIAKLCHAASNIHLRLATLPPEQFDELSTVLNIGINRVRVHFGLPSGWSVAEEWAIIVAHGDITSGGNEGMVESVPPTPPTETPDAPTTDQPRRRLFR